METTYYTLTAREIIVSGDGISAAVGAPARQLVCVRRPASQEEQAQDNVIDLAAWKAAREEETRLGRGSGTPGWTKPWPSLHPSRPAPGETTRNGSCWAGNCWPPCPS